MRTATESDTWGGRLTGVIDLSAESTLTIGVDHQDNKREAILNNDTAGMVMSHMWADARLEQTGLFAEYSTELTAADRLDMGLRYDRVKASLGNPNAPGVRTPNQKFQLYYGTTADDNTENNVGGFVRLKHSFTDIPAYLYASASRSVRTADSTERYMAKWVAGGAMRWVGNPDLDPEKHHQLEFGMVSETNDMNVSGSVYYNDVDDFILYDRAHGQDGILQTDNAVIYRNIDAELYGFEFEASKSWGNWSAGFTLAYTHADNKSDHRPIAQIPPLEGTISLDYTSGPWSAGGVVRAAAKQTRVDDNTATGSGLDSEKTPGWGVLDLHAGYKIRKQWQIEVGVKNVFDKDYAQHLNKASAIDAGSQVDEPGRSFWVSMNAKF
jgi:iron complex outermembrane receptor protein